MRVFVWFRLGNSEWFGCRMIKCVWIRSWRRGCGGSGRISKGWIFEGEEEGICFYVGEFRCGNIYRLVEWLWREF